MSSRIVTGKAAVDAKTFDWRSANGHPASAPMHALSGHTSQRDNNSAEIETLRQEANSLRIQIAEMAGTAEARVQQAYQTGRREGEQQGRQETAARLDPAIARLARTVEELAGLRSRFRREAEEDLVRLGIGIARKVLHREIAYDPEALLGLIKAALQRIESRELHRLRVHPSSSAAIEKALGVLSLPARVEIVSDGSLEPGAAIFETARGNLDASVDTQLREIERGFLDLVQSRKL